jgi:hypothetical protein
VEAIISEVLAVVTAIASVVALVLARQIVRQARVARAEANAAEQASERFRLVAARQAAVDRDIAEYVRIIARVERVGEVVEDLFWHASRDPDFLSGDVTLNVQPTGWTPGMRYQWIEARNRLGRALVGLSHVLPKCAAILAVNTESPTEAFNKARAARAEVLFPAWRPDEGAGRPPHGCRRGMGRFAHGWR